jgi:hypothetical protein
MSPTQPEEGEDDDLQIWDPTATPAKKSWMYWVVDVDFGGRTVPS